MVILKLGIRTEEADLHIRNIIGSITDDAYHVPIIEDDLFNGSLPYYVCIVRKTRYF